MWLCPGGIADGVALRQVLLVVGADPQVRLAVEQEPEQQLTVVFDGKRIIGSRTGGADDPDLGEPIGGRADARLPALEPGPAPRLPRRVAARWWTNRWPPKSPVDVAVGSVQLVVGDGLVLRRARELDHLQAGGALEDPVPDAGRLEHAVPGLQHERRPLVLVDHPDPAREQ